MNSINFEALVVKSQCNDFSLLQRKGSKEGYASDEDRLLQFKLIASMMRANSIEACLALMAKHFSSICVMALDFSRYPIEKWEEKLTDIRNYTHLMFALLVEISQNQEE